MKLVNYFLIADAYSKRLKLLEMNREINIKSRMEIKHKMLMVECQV